LAHFQNVGIAKRYSILENGSRAKRWPEKARETNPKSKLQFSLHTRAAPAASKKQTVSPTFRQDRGGPFAQSPAVPRNRRA